MSEPLIWSDEYTGPRWTYGCSYRPVGTGAVPAGWILGSVNHETTFAHGTVQYPRPLTDAEIAAYQLTFVPDPASAAVEPLVVPERPAEQLLQEIVESARRAGGRPSLLDEEHEEQEEQEEPAPGTFRQQGYDPAHFCSDDPCRHYEGPFD